jgi:hypothetical protein
MIDANLDPAGAVDEIEFLAQRLQAPDLREAVNRLLVIGMTRAIAQTRKEYRHHALTPRQEDRVISDYLLNVNAQFRDAVGAKALQRDRAINPVSPGPAGGAAAPVPVTRRAASPSPGVSLSPGRRAPLPHPGADL